MAFDPSSGLINGANLVGGLLRQGQQTQDYISGMFDTAARRRAGDAAARGDYSSAQGLLGGRGMLEEAEAMRSLGATRKTLKATAEGDYGTALDAAAEGGDERLFGNVQIDEQKDRAERAAWLGHAADALLQVKDPAKRGSAFKQFVAPTLKAMGFKDDQLSLITDQTLTDEGLNAFKTSLGQTAALDVQKLDDGTIIGVDKKAGTVKVLHQGEVKGVVVGNNVVNPVTGAVMYEGPQKLSEGETLVQPGGGAAGVKAYPEVTAAATAAGATEPEKAYLQRLAFIESRGDPRAENGKSKGIFQFHADTFASVGGGDINSIEDQTKAALALQKRDRKVLQENGLQADDANTYIMHQQGPGGGLALLSAPEDVNAVAALTPVYGNAKTARKAIVNNGGSDGMTAGEFVDMWRKRWAKGSAGSSPTGATVLAQGKDKPKRAYTEATPAELTAAGYPPGTRAQKDAETGKFENIKQPTEAESKAAGYANRVLGATTRLNELYEAGVRKPDTLTSQLVKPDPHGVIQILAKTDKDRQFIQAARDWLAPILRKDTGAAVTDSELATYMDIYIPRFEDSNAVLRQKAKARVDAVRSLIGETNGAYEARHGSPKFRMLMPGETAGKATSVKAPSGKVVKIEVIGD